MKHHKTPPTSRELSEALAIIDTYDYELSKSFAKQVMALINDAYFRTRLVGFDQWDERSNPEAPLIYISNHSGMALPWDAVAYVSAIFRKFDYAYDKTLRILISPFFMRVGLLSLYQIPDIFTRSGGIEATYKNFEASMQLESGNILIYPEGVKGIGKGFDKRYQLQRVSSSVVRMALKYKTDLVFFASINAEYIHPYAYRSQGLNRFGKRLLGIPFLPLTLLLPLFILQPWLFYFAFPANLTFVRKARISWQELLTYVGHADPHTVTEQQIASIRARLQERLQTELDEAEERYGRRPFGWKSFWRQVKRHYRSFPLWLPVGWPLLFWEFQRRYEKYGSEARLNLTGVSIFRILSYQPWLIVYYLPVIGWLPIILWSRQLIAEKKKEKEKKN